MKIFISWSGDRSKAVATALRKWLPDVMHQVEVWTSEHGVEAGAVWGRELTAALDECQFGVICLTPENQDSAWLLFEAGCLSRASRITHVVPYLLDVSPTDIRYPLAQFQGVTADQAGTLKLLQSINEAGQLQMPADRLERALERWWSDLEKALEAIPPDARNPQLPRRSERDMLEELLGLVRNSQVVRHEPRIVASSTAQSEDEFRVIRIDVSQFIEGRSAINVSYRPSMGFTYLLRTIRARLRKFVRVAPSSYGTEWILRSRLTGRLYEEITGDEDFDGLVIPRGESLQVIRPSTMDAD